jgi:hypothetical protein
MDEGTESLVLGGGGQVALRREMIEESGDVGAPEHPRVTPAVEGDEGPDPVGVRFLGAGERAWMASRGSCKYIGAEGKR